MPINVKFSQHSLIKIDLLKAYGVNISKEIVVDIIKFPDKIETGYKNRLIAQKKIDDEHVLRVVYEKQEDEILIITAYPGRRSRYEKD